MRFKADSVGEAGLFEGAELSGPIDVTFGDRSPLNFASAILDGVFAVAVMDAVFGKRIPGAGEGIKFAAHDGVAGIPVESKMGRLDGIQRARGFAAGGRVAFKFVFEHKKNALFTCGFSG